MKKAIITGVSGFVGSHLAEYLVKQGIEVYGIIRRRSNLENLESLKGEKKIKLTFTGAIDIRDPKAVNQVIWEIEPDYIFHLAALSYVPDSFLNPTDTITTNVIGTLNVLEATRCLYNAGYEPIIMITGSSEEYGLVNAPGPITEKHELLPLSPYGVSKVAADRLGIQYAHTYKMKVVVTRAFNHTGPRRGSCFVCSTFAKQIAEIEKGIQKPIIYVGNLDAKRDFTDVRDIVKAYLLAVEKCSFGHAYNICSEKTITMKEVLNRLINLSKVDIWIKLDKKRLRPSDVPVLWGDCAKFKEATGWKKKIPFEQTLKDLLNYWRERV